jgi:hypothetical protein
MRGSLRVVTPCGDLGQEIDASRSPASPFVILASTMRPITIKYNFTDLPKVCAKGRSCAVEGSFATRESSRIAQIPEGHLSGRKEPRTHHEKKILSIKTIYLTSLPTALSFLTQNHKPLISFIYYCLPKVCAKLTGFWVRSCGFWVVLRCLAHTFGRSAQCHALSPSYS